MLDVSIRVYVQFLYNKTLTDNLQNRMFDFWELSGVLYKEIHIYIKNIYKICIYMYSYIYIYLYGTLRGALHGQGKALFYVQLQVFFSDSENCSENSAFLFRLYAPSKPQYGAFLLVIRSSIVFASSNYDWLK